VLDGIGATEALLTRQPTSRVVLIAVHDDPELVERGGAPRQVRSFTWRKIRLPASSFLRSEWCCAASGTARRCEAASAWQSFSRRLGRQL